MFDVGLIVLREVVVYIRRESGAARGLGEEGEREEVMRVQSRLRSGLIPSITDLDRFGSIRDRGTASHRNDRAAAAKKEPVQRKACYFADRTAGECSYALAPFYHSSTGGRKFAGQCGEPDGCNNHKRGN